MPTAEYEELKRIEDQILNFPKEIKKDNVKTYVIASGI